MDATRFVRRSAAEYRGLPLRDFFRERFRPTFLATARPATVAVYETTLALWQLLMPQCPELSLGEIDNAWLGQFRAALVAREISPFTVNKYLRAIRALVRKAGPAGPGNQDALGILEAIPWVAEVKTAVTRPRAIPLDVLGAIYRSCDAAQVPRVEGITPAEWWRGIVVVASQVGIRRRALLGITWGDYSIRDRALRVSSLLDKAGVERIKPLNIVAMEHLDHQRCNAMGSLEERVLLEIYDGDPLVEHDALANRKIFPWPYRSRRMFDIEWHRLQDAAGVAAEEHYHFHDLKKTCGTQLGTVAGAFQVQAMLDHASVTTSQFYCAGDEQLRQALERMPHPKEFEAVS